MDRKDDACVARVDACERVPGCPFNTERYAAGLANIGVPQPHPAGRLVLLRRAIAGTPLADGMGPWPYLWIDGPADIAALYEDFRHLVTVTAVTQPGFVPKARGEDAVLFKPHFVYDPALPAPSLSKRARARLRRAEAVGTFEIVTDAGAPRAMAELYEALKLRRGLAGTHVDFPARHFETIAESEGGVFVRVASAAGVGAMACGVIFGDMLQVLHTAISEEGLQWNASYLLMDGLQRLARARGVRLLTGGMPTSASPGLRTFKERWANGLSPVYLVRIVNDARRYAALCAGRRGREDFFPAYRAPR